MLEGTAWFSDVYAKQASDITNRISPDEVTSQQ